MADDTTSSFDEREPVVPGAPRSDDGLGNQGDPSGELLGGDLADPGEYELAADETEAEELENADDTIDDTPDKGDPEDVVIDDEQQLAEAESAAAAARSSRPVRRSTTDAATAEGKALTPKKSTATRRRDAAAASTAHRRTTPGVFVNQSAAELRKVQWPTGDQLRQYFVVVLVFVLIIITYVGLLDFGFGWGILKLLGK